MTTESTQLLPCPFCGTQPIVEQTGFSGRARYIYCNLDDCLRPKAVGENEEAAVRSWNTRATPPATRSPPDSVRVCTQDDLRRLVDAVWLHATEAAHYPSTKTADMLISAASLTTASGGDDVGKAPQP